MFLHWSSGTSTSTVWELINYFYDNNQNLAVDAFGNPKAFVGVVRFGSNFVAGYEDGKIYYSSDGNSWTEVDTGITAIDRIFVGNGVVAVEYTSTLSPELKYSSDLSTWTSATNTSQLETFYVNGLYWRWDEFGYSYSTDLNTWTSGTNGNDLNADAVEVLYNGTIYVAITFNKMYSSTNGTDWTDRTPSTNAPNGVEGASGNESLAYGGGVWLVVGEYFSGIVGYYRSTNGTSWSYVTDTSAGPALYGATGTPEVIYAGGNFYAFNEVDDIAVSSTGANNSWSVVELTDTPGIGWPIGSDPPTVSAATDGTQLIGVGDSGLIARYRI